jgi:hypothetical protein
VRKAFAHLHENYNTRSFRQKFFYRHYSKSDTTYERLVEASVDIWRHNGYRTIRKAAGEREAMRINQLRRSLDIKGMVQYQTPLFLGNILQTDFVGYQTQVKGNHMNVYGEVSNIKTEFDRFKFTFEGITTYDGQQVYKIKYKSSADSILTTSGYVNAPTASGTLFITTDTFAFVKTEEIREDGTNTIRTSAYYLKHNNKYYPYHLVREGENHHTKTNTFHIELMAVEISHDEKDQFAGEDLTRANLLNIPYDSLYWNASTMLKTTPLEKKIILSLGGGKSLNKQFYLYKQYELNVTNGGVNGEEKFKWFKEDSKGKRILYLSFWNSNFESITDLLELENIKRLNQRYQNKIAFVMLSLENDETVWKQLITKYNLFADGIINYRIGSDSEIAKLHKIKKTPAFVLVGNDGSIFENTKKPSDPLLEEDFKFLMTQKNKQ